MDVILIHSAGIRLVDFTSSSPRAFDNKFSQRSVPHACCFCSWHQGSINKDVMSRVRLRHKLDNAVEVLLVAGLDCRNVCVSLLA